MRDKYFYEVMFDDTSIDVSKEVGLVWSIANSLRGAGLSVLWRLPKMQL